MKLHIGADSRTGLVHSASVTAVNIHDRHAVPNLLHGEETRFYGTSAYWGLAKNANWAFAMLAMLNISEWGRPLTGEMRPT